MFARGGQCAARCCAQFIIACVALVLLGEEFHGIANPRHFRSGNIERSRVFGSGSHDDHIKILAQRIHRNLDANLCAGLERYAFGHHLHQPAVDRVFFHFEIGNAIAEQSAHPVILFKQGHAMPGARQLLRTRHARRARADNRNAFSSLA